MKKISEKLLLELGFVRNDVSAEESGDTPFHYFTYGFERTNGCILITCANDECVDENWYSVTFFNYDSAGKIVNGERLEKLCEILNELV